MLIDKYRVPLLHLVGNACADILAERTADFVELTPMMLSAKSVKPTL